MKFIFFIFFFLNCFFSYAQVEINEDSPVALEPPEETASGHKSLTTSRPWRAPDFSKQNEAIGYTSETFAIPKNLENQVRFWIDIYSKYNTDQGVIHDAVYIDLIYEVVDFNPIMTRTDWNIFKKNKEKEKLIKAVKKKWIGILKKFEKLQDPSSLSLEERKIWDYFLKIEETKKFRKAQTEKRIRFQLGQRDRFIQAIFYSGRYIEDFESIFREMGLPIELTRLPFVESSYNVLARSKVGASGIWQIMPRTAKPYFKKDPSIDMRNHPIEATVLAAKILRSSFMRLQSWPLALTGYNHGPMGVQKLVQHYKTRDIGDLVKITNSKKKLGFASRNFFASFLAALEIEKNAPKYFGAISWSRALEGIDIKLSIPLPYKNLLNWFGGDSLHTQIFNPHLNNSAIVKGRPLPKGAVISVPRQKYELVRKELMKLTESLTAN